MKLEGNFNKIKSGLKILGISTLGLGSLSAKDMVDFKNADNVSKTENTKIQDNNSLISNNGETVELTPAYMAFLREFEGLAVQDTMPTPEFKYGFRKMGEDSILNKTMLASYFGSEKTSYKGPFFMKQKKDDPIYTLKDVEPSMGSKALFYNFDRNGKGHLFELPDTVRVFSDDLGNYYAVACGNLLKLVSEDEKIVEIKEKEKKSEEGKQTPIQIKEIPTETQRDWTDFGQGSNPFSDSKLPTMGYGIAVTEKTISTGKEIDPTYESWGDYPSWGDYILLGDHPSWGNYCEKYKNKKGFKHGKECHCSHCKSWFGIHIHIGH